MIRSQSLPVLLASFRCVGHLMLHLITDILGVAGLRNLSNTVNNFKLFELIPSSV